MTIPAINKRDALPNPAHVLHTHSSIGNIDLFTGDQMRAYRATALNTGAPTAEDAARWVEKRTNDFMHEHGHTDPDTGALEFGSGAHAEEKEEYVGELEEIIAGLRSLMPCNAAPAGWSCSRARGHSSPCAAELTEPKNQSEWDRVYGLIRYWANRARNAEAILQELHDKFSTRVYGTGSYIKRDMRDRIAAVLDATGDQPQADSAAKPLDMTATGLKRISAAADVLAEVMAFVKLGEDLPPKVSDALSGLRAMQAIAPQADAATPTDSARYRLLRRGQHWSVIDGAGDTLRAEALDAAVDAAIEAQAPGARGEGA